MGDDTATLRSSLEDGIHETTTYLDELETKLEEYDRQSKLSDGAVSYFRAGLKSTREAVEELRTLTSGLNDQSEETSDPAVDAARQSLESLVSSLTGLQTMAKEYDAKISVSVRNVNKSNPIFPSLRKQIVLILNTDIVVVNEKKKRKFRRNGEEKFEKQRDAHNRIFRLDHKSLQLDSRNMNNDRFEDAKKQIDNSVEHTTSYLEDLKARVEKYKKDEKIAETTSSYLEQGLDATTDSVKTLSESSKQLVDKSKNGSEEGMQAAYDSLHKTQQSLEKLQEKAEEYDRMLQEQTGSKMSPLKSLEELTQNTRQKASSSLTSAIDYFKTLANDLHMKLSIVTGEGVRLLEFADNSTGASAKAQGALARVWAWDDYLGVTRKAAKIDSYVTLGIGTRAVKLGANVVNESLDYVSETLRHAKIAASQSEGAQQVEQQVLDTTNKAVEMAKQKTGQTDEDMATKMKKNGERQAESAVKKANEVAENVKQNANNQTEEFAKGAKQKGENAAEKLSANVTKATTTAKEKGKGATEHVSNQAPSSQHA